MLDLLTSLVDKSLVVYEPLEENARYRLLETIREYALERLALSGAGHPPIIVARADGSHAFSRTLEEHNRAVARYRAGK